MTSALNGWHTGELAVQRKLGYADAVKSSWAAIESAMREQHRIFHTCNLPFIPITTIDDSGRPWGSIVAGASGKIGFVKSPDSHTLVVNAQLWDGEPLLETIRAFLLQKDGETITSERLLTAGIGIEFSTRRRNKFAGSIKGVKLLHKDYEYELSLQVTQALGNCPKYINVRNLVPYPATHPSVAYQNLQMKPSERLPKEAISLITEADTVFIASVYKSHSFTQEKYPSHAGMNARGGLPGFMRVRPSDDRTVVLPDYSGNQFLSSLGNVESSKLAGLTIVSFTTGDVLYLTGRAQVLIGPPALNIMAKHASIITLDTTGYILVRDALPVRQKPGTIVERSPYSPKIKYLLEEPEALTSASSGHKARLTHATQFSDDIAIFRFEVISKAGVKELKIRPGQAIILDFMDWVGPPVYRHMANDAPGSINDDRVRTWTVSSAHENKGVTWFELTMREMKGGAVTGALFNLVRKQPLNEWGRSMPMSTTTVISDIVGVTGDYDMGNKDINALWIAGGIGVTPFMAMFVALIERGSNSRSDIILTLSTREPNIFLSLINRSLCQPPAGVNIRIDLFTNQNYTEGEMIQNVQVIVHKGRIPLDYWLNVSYARDVFICGPGGFADAAVEGLRAAAVPNSRIYREGFY